MRKQSGLSSEERRKASANWSLLWAYSRRALTTRVICGSVSRCSSSSATRRSKGRRGGLAVPDDEADQSHDACDDHQHQVLKPIKLLVHALELNAELGAPP